MNFNYFFAGSISGIAQTVVGHPFDTLKVLQQNNKLKVNSLKNLYKGISMPLIQTPLICGVSFFLNDSLNSYFTNEYYSGLFSGFFSSFIICPFEYYKINSQIQKKIYFDFKSLKKSYSNINYVILRETPALSIYFGLYNQCLNNNISSFSAGGIAGVSSWLFTYPLDTIKTRMQSGKTNSLRESLLMGNLFKGLQICLIRAFIVNSIGFYSYDYMLNTIN